MKEIPKIYESDYLLARDRLTQHHWPSDRVQVCLHAVNEGTHLYCMDGYDGRNAVHINVVILTFELRRISYTSQLKKWHLLTEVTIIPDDENHRTNF